MCRNYRQDPDGPRTAFLPATAASRKTLTVDEIGEIFSAVKRVKPDIICFVDNCYGEFIEDKEPTQVGADLMAGSLIKNLGGGIAPTGGYIVGRKDLVELASYRLTAPGLGGEMGATLGDTAREFYEGLFFAPHVSFRPSRLRFLRLPYSRISDSKCLRYQKNAAAISSKRLP